MANSGVPRVLPPERAGNFSVRDETITAYAPAVKDAVAAGAL